MSGSNDDVLDGGPNDPRWPAITTYLARGWSLLAIVPDTKEPPAYECGDCKDARSRDVHDVVACTCPICHGVYAATTDPERLARALKQVPGALVGVACGATSGITVVDFDTTVDATTGMTGLDTLDQWESWVPGGWSLPSTLRARTKSGGLHLFYETGDDRAITSRVRVLPGVDIKSNGGYVVLPPEPGSLRAWVGSVATAQPTSDELLLWLRTAPGSRPTRGSGYGSGGSNGPLDLSVIGNGGPPQGSQDDFIRDWLFHLYMFDGVTTKQALLQRVWPEVDSWTQDPSRRWKEWMIESKIDKLMRKFDPPEEIPTWRPAVVRRDGTTAGGAFETSASSTANVITVDFGGDASDGGDESSGGGGGGGAGGSDVPIGYGGHRGDTYDDTGNAHRFARIHSDRIRYVADMKTWIIWNGVRWVRDRTNAALDMTLAVIDEIEHEAESAGDDGDAVRGHARASRGKNARKAMLELAAAVSDIAITADQLDTNPEILVVENGVVDLRTCTFTRSRPEDLCTLSAAVAYDPAATCPRWVEHVQLVTCGDADLAAYLQRLAGYTLTGLTTEQAFFSLEGTGANGKNVFIEPIMFLLGEYATVASSKLVTQGDKSHAAILADLVGARMVFVDEIPQGKHVDVERVKSLTGSARVKAQFMRENWFFFKPQMKLWIAGNEQPRFKDSSDGIWRRMKRILFNAKVPEDRKILDYARILYEEEGAGILNWCLEGLRAWRELGTLGTPEGVRDAVAELRSDEDHVAAFIDECLEVTGNVKQSGDWITNARLFQLYTGWCDANGVYKADRLNGVNLGKRVSGLPHVERFNDRRSGDKERGLGGVRATKSALTIMGKAVL